MARALPTPEELEEFNRNHPRPWRVSSHEDASAFGAYVVYDANHKEVHANMDYMTAHFMVNSVNFLASNFIADNSYKQI